MDQRVLDKWQGYFSNNYRATPFSRSEWIWPKGEQDQFSPYVLDLGCGYAPLEFKNRNTTRTIRLSGEDYEDIVSAPGEELEAVGNLLEQLRSRSREWDICDFRSLLPDSVLLSVFSDGEGNLVKNSAIASLLKGLSCSLVPHQTYYHVQIPDRWETFEEHLGKKLAYQMRSAQGRRTKYFNTSSLRRATPETLDQDLNALFDLHTARWRAKGHSGHFGNEANRERFRLRSAGLLALGQLRLYTLWLDEKPASALFTLSDERRIYYHCSGFDIEFGKHHPTKVLIAEAIKDGLKHGPGEFDFMKGEEEYKLFWANGKRTTYRLVVARNTPQGLAALAALKIQSRLQDLRQSKSK